jgi:hypothetical protein
MINYQRLAQQNNHSSFYAFALVFLSRIAIDG